MQVNTKSTCPTTFVISPDITPKQAIEITSTGDQSSQMSWLSDLGEVRWHVTRVLVCHQISWVRVFMLLSLAVTAGNAASAYALFTGPDRPAYHGAARPQGEPLQPVELA